MIRALLTYFFGPRCDECLYPATRGTFDSSKRRAKHHYWCEEHYLGTQSVRLVETLERQM